MRQNRDLTMAPNSERRPWRGRRCETTSGLATKRAPSLSARPAATVLPGLTRLPRLVARGYPAAVPGRVNVRSMFLRRNRQRAKTWRVINSWCW